ncbi:MAG: hypothetical protein WCR49_13240, partial [Opitutae bacterium]
CSGCFPHADDAARSVVSVRPSVDDVQEHAPGLAQRAPAIAIWMAYGNDSCISDTHQTMLMFHPLSTAWSVH